MILRWLGVLFGLAGLMLAVEYGVGLGFKECQQVASDLVVCELRAPLWVLEAAILSGAVGIGCLAASWWRHERRGDSPWA